MIYCVGKRDRYDAALEAGPFYKVGRGLRNGIWHDGGSVWRTADEARAFIQRNGIEATRAVYGVEADWETDTIQLRDEPYRRLVKTATVVKAPPDGDAPLA